MCIGIDRSRIEHFYYNPHTTVLPSAMPSLNFKQRFPTGLKAAKNDKPFEKQGSAPFVQEILCISSPA